MSTKIEKEGMSSQMMIIMDELFRGDNGASYEDVIVEYYKRKINSSLTNFSELSNDTQIQMKREVRKAKTFLAKRLKEKKLIIEELKIYTLPNDKRCFYKVFKYPQEIGDFDPIEDLRYKFKRMKLHELSGLMGQCVGLFPNSWLMNFITQIDEYNHEINGDSRIRKIVYFDNNEKHINLHLLPTLVSLIREKRVIQFQYMPYNGKRFYVKVHPQILKEYNLRWFLVGLTENKDGVLQTSVFALDRMGLEIIECNDVQYINSNIDYNEYFKDVVGISVPRNTGVEDVKICVTDQEALEYIRSKPIHPSQEIVGSIVTYHLKLNYEFETKLLEFSDRAIVLSPIILKDRIAERAERIAQLQKQ